VISGTRSFKYEITLGNQTNSILSGNSLSFQSTNSYMEINIARALSEIKFIGLYPITIKY